MAGEYRKQQRQMRSDAETMPLASSNPGPDSEAEAKAEIKAIEGHFGDDDDALAVVMARFEGHSPEETQAMFNLTKTRYESTLKRIRRKIDQYKKKGAEQ
jgi:DNA-directed RNA polymerase specialized sigma24 family protein